MPLQCVRTVTQEDGSTVNVVFVKGSRPDNAMETPTLSEEIPEGFWAVPVEIGISDNSNVEIKSGVEEGPRSSHRSSPCRRGVDAHGEELSRAAGRL